MATLVRLVEHLAQTILVNSKTIATMKNIFKSLMLVAVAAMGIACQEKVEDFTPERANEVVMTITADVDETRTYIDETNKIVKWSEGDQLKVIENSAVYRTSEAATIDADGKAQFAVSFPKKSGAVAYNAVFPASAVVEETEVNANEVQVAVKSFQYPSEDSFDPQADVLVAKQLEFEAQPTELNMQFKRLVAMGKMTLTNFDENAEIVKVVFATEDQPLAGRNVVNTTTGKVVEYGAETAITLNYDGITSRDIYFTCNPFALEADEVFTVTVVCADNKAYVREVVIPATGSLKFTEGNLSTFSVNMATATSVGGGKSGWNLVKDVNDLAVGDQIIIAAKDYNYALSTEQKSNNRGQIAITKSGDTLGDPSSTVQILTLTNGLNANTFGLYTGSGYLYAASSSSNYLKTQTSIDKNASWSISIASTGTATIKATGSFTRNVMQYNQSSSLFACYSSATQKAIVIYKNYVGGGADVPAEPSFSLSTESLEFDAEGGPAEINVVAENNFYGAVTATTDAEWLTIKNDDYTFTITADANEDYARTATITFSSQDCEDVEVVVSQSANPNAAVKVTVAEFLAAEEDDTTLYRLRGTITSVVNTTYGNFDLTDDTGTVYIYGLMSKDGATNKYWAQSGAKLGDDIEIITARASFNGTPQGENAWFVEVYPGTRAFYTVDPAAVDFASAGGEQDIEVSAYNTTAAVTATSDNSAFAVEVNGYVVTVTAAANELEEEVTGNITIKVGDLKETVVKATLAAKPASGVVEGGSSDFQTISATNTSYVTGKTTASWNYKNCAILKGGTSDSSPAFKMIGDASNRALCMNGKTSAVGSITSPTLTTGCGTLKFNYGLPFSDTKIKFRVDILQNGTVVKTFTINNSSASKLTKYSHEEAINVAGDFQIVFTNLSPSNSSSNKDRTAIWDVEWTGYAN